MKNNKLKILSISAFCLGVFGFSETQCAQENDNNVNPRIVASIAQAVNDEVLDEPGFYLPHNITGQDGLNENPRIQEFIEAASSSQEQPFTSEEMKQGIHLGLQGEQE